MIAAPQARESTPGSGAWGDAFAGASAIPISDATDGTITIDAITASVVSGTFDLTFPKGSMRGSFNATFCAPPDAGRRRSTAG